MHHLYVLYDAHCALCQRSRQWLQRQPSFVELRFLPFQADEVACRFPGLDRSNLANNLTVISDEGALYGGPHAWLICLWALRDYREWSFRLAHPALLPLTRRFCSAVSTNRLKLSALLFGSDHTALSRHLESFPENSCSGAACTIPAKQHSHPRFSNPIQ